MPEFTTLMGGLSFAACPRWRDGRLYVSDFYTHGVLAVTVNGAAETVAQLPEQPTGLGFLPDGIWDSIVCAPSDAAGSGTS